MRNFNKWEKEILQHLSALPAGANLRIDEFLNSFFLKQKLGRALIVNTESRYAVYFLKNQRWNDERTKNDEVSKLLDLLSLLKFLSINGYVSFQAIEHNRQKAIYFLQDMFTNPAQSSSAEPVVLNASGDYLATHDTIVNRTRQVVYKGIIFEYETYELIASTTIGSFIISKNINELTTFRDPVAHSSKRQTILSSVLLLLVFGLFAGLAFVMQQRSQLSEEKLSTLLENHNEIRSRLKVLEEKLYNYVPEPDSNTSKNRSQANRHYGIDVSKWNGNIKTDLDLVDSISFVICKATEGLTAMDPDFASNWSLLNERKIVKGAYHFFHVDDDPIQQAEFFWSVIQKHGPAEITPIVDIEQAGIGTQTDPVKIQLALLLFLKHLEGKVSRVPMIYTGEYFANTYLVNDSFAKYPLWLAEYTQASFPSIPLTWKNAGFRIWQKSDEYSIDSKLTDLDVHFGNMDDLIK